VALALARHRLVVRLRPVLAAADVESEQELAAATRSMNWIPATASNSAASASVVASSR
jgi:hypothetical protein